MPYLNSLMGLFQSATRSLHDALPISEGEAAGPGREQQIEGARRAFYSGFVAEAIDAFCATEQVDGSVAGPPDADGRTDRKSTRLNSSHVAISYAVFYLKKKKLKITLK